MPARLVRVTLPVGDIERATTFYGRVLHSPGRRVSAGVHQFQCGAAALVCRDPRAEGEGRDAAPNTEPVWLAVPDLENHFARTRTAGCREIGVIETAPSGERWFRARDPFGNPVCFVEEKTAAV